MSIYESEGFSHDKTAWAAEKKTIDDTKSQVKTQLHNKMYQRLLTDYIQCSSKFVGSFHFAPVLEKQLARTDLDTVCAFELYQMKKHFAQGDCLDYNNFMK